MTDYTELKRKAEAAIACGPGVMRVEPDDTYEEGVASRLTTDHADIADSVEPPYADFFAAANPQTVLGMIKHVHDQHADDQCWMPDQNGLNQLFAAAGLPPKDYRVGDKAVMLKNCERFVDHVCEDGGPWKSYAELEAERDDDKKLIAELRAANEANRKRVGELAYLTAPFWRKPPVRLPSGEWSEPWPEGEFLCKIRKTGGSFFTIVCTTPEIDVPHPKGDAFAEWIADIPKTPEGTP